METRTNRIWIVMMVLLLGLAGAIRAEDLGTVFSYQGRLETAGSPPLNGSYDFQFRVYDTPDVGTGILIGESMAEPNVPVTEGIFTVQLDPDPNETAPNLFNGEIRYLEIAVRKTGSAESYFTISPRQRINAAPYAITASSARWLRGRNSTEKVVYVDDLGNVGVGTTNPTAKLEVNGNIKTAGVYEDGSGNVGIGTTSPGAKLDVNGTVKGAGFKGVPWRSPQWFFTNINDSDTQGYFPSPDHGSYPFFNYHLPFNVTVEGFVVSADTDIPDDKTFYFRMYRWVSYPSHALVYSTAGYSCGSGWSKKLPLYNGPVSLSAGHMITVRAIGNYPGEIACWLYGRYNE
jgi:hypothetical protein